SPPGSADPAGLAGRARLVRLRTGVRVRTGRSRGGMGRVRRPGLLRDGRAGYRRAGRGHAQPGRNPRATPRDARAGRAPDTYRDTCHRTRIRAAGGAAPLRSTASIVEPSEGGGSGAGRIGAVAAVAVTDPTITPENFVPDQIVTDDLDLLLEALPPHIAEALQEEGRRTRSEER